MAGIRVRQAHTFSKPEARARFSSFEEMMGKVGVTLKWRGDSARVKGVGVSGDVEVFERHVEVRLKLGMLAKAAGVDPVRLERSITRRLAEAFEDTASE
jgi:putative polyhydroxyalkanoate system protein